MFNMCHYVPTSSSRPVCMDHRKISKESWAPAPTSSPLTSTAREENCAGRGDVNVRKFRYLCRSNARTVPSREALTMTKPLVVKVTLVMLLVCSVKVTKQRPLLVFHTLT